MSGKQYMPLNESCSLIDKLNDPQITTLDLSSSVALTPTTIQQIQENIQAHLRIMRLQSKSIDNLFLSREFEFLPTLKENDLKIEVLVTGSEAPLVIDLQELPAEEIELVFALRILGELQNVMAMQKKDVQKSLYFRLNIQKFIPIIHNLVKGVNKHNIALNTVLSSIKIHCENLQVALGETMKNERAVRRQTERLTLLNGPKQIFHEMTSPIHNTADPLGLYNKPANAKTYAEEITSLITQANSYLELLSSANAFSRSNDWDRIIIGVSIALTGLAIFAAGMTAMSASFGASVLLLSAIAVKHALALMLIGVGMVSVGIMSAAFGARLAYSGQQSDLQTEEDAVDFNPFSSDSSDSDDESVSNPEEVESATGFRITAQRRCACAE